MDETPEQVYTALLRQLASPLGTEPEVLAGMFRDIERMHLMGQITDWQLQDAREAYARTPASKTAEVASWAVDKAKEGLHAGANLVRDRTRTALTTYTLRDPIRAMPDRRRHWRTSDGACLDPCAVRGTKAQTQDLPMNEDCLSKKVFA